MTKSAVLQALATVDDPDLRKDLVSLNMIRDLKVEDGKVEFTICLTTPACPLKDKIKKDCMEAIKNAVGDDVTINIEFTAEISSGRKSNEPVLPGVKNIIVVASGKGGVGKSTVSVNLALGLAKNGAKVGLIDADIYGPSIPTMLGLKNARPEVVKVDGKDKIKPIEKYGLKVLSIGFLVDDDQAVVWRGPMVSSALRQFVTDCEWGELDYLLLDLPPGTGDVHLTLVQTVPVTGAIVVTTPQEIAMLDVKKAIAMFKMPQINVPILGIVENMAYFTPAELPDNKYYIFGEGGGAQLAEHYKLPLLGQIPIVQSIRAGGDSGVPVMIEGEDTTRQAFQDLVEYTVRNISIRNEQQKPTQKVELSV